MYVCACQVASIMSDYVTLWTVARRASLAMGILQARTLFWSELPCPPPADLPDTGIELRSLMPPALAGGFFTASAAWAAGGVIDRV